MISLHPGDKRQVTVRAHYANGKVEDVTRWVKFGTSDGNVANVDDGGRVTVQGRGEAAITVWFSSKVTFARIVSPFPSAPAPAVYARSPRNNFIDGLVVNKLQALGLPPSNPCSDSEFIRRAFLDAAGILPTPKETTAFLADTRPDKRARLIDALLERPEFVDYWTYKWCDLLLVSSRKLNPPALKAFQGWIRQSVQADKPWDVFARELLTARGSNLENGAANYYVLHKEPIDLTETTTQAFLGMSLTCARCHNHPLEKWTQRDYFQMANLFARVRLKNGDQPGEALVIAAKNGDINLPRLNIPLAPRPLDGQAMTLTDTSDRRELLADWLTSPGNPYFARAVVNRVWRNFMGRGLVEAEDDLRLTNPPSNPALLDALARDFAQPNAGKLAPQNALNLAPQNALNLAPQNATQPAQPNAFTNASKSVSANASIEERNPLHVRHTAPIAAHRPAARTAGVSALARNLEPALFPVGNSRSGGVFGAALCLLFTMFATTILIWDMRQDQMFWMLVVVIAFTYGAIPGLALGAASGLAQALVWTRRMRLAGLACILGSALVTGRLILIMVDQLSYDPEWRTSLLQMLFLFAAPLTWGVILMLKGLRLLTAKKP